VLPREGGGVMSTIKAVVARQVLDSRGEPTIEVEVMLADGVRGRAAAPSGASTGEFEAVELRDGGPAFGGRGVLRAIETVRSKIAPALVGEHVWAQETIDRRLCELDGTPNKGRLGANAIVATSVAVARAAAATARTPLYRSLARDGQPPTLPVPFLNVINGGAHARNSLDFQEFRSPLPGPERSRRRSGSRARCSRRSSACSPSADSQPASATRAASPLTWKGPRPRWR
jgi:enolase